MKIPPPSQGIIDSLKNDQQNIANLKKWIEVIKSPFNDYPDADNFTVHSLLGNEDDLQHLVYNGPPGDIVYATFPSTARALLGKEDNGDCHGYLYLHVNNKASIGLNTHADYKKGPIYLGKLEETIQGTWEEVVKVYLEYIRELAKIPALLEAIV